MPINTTFFTWISLLFIPALIFAHQGLEDSMEKPRYKIISKISQSNLAEGDISQTCYVYNDWIIKQTNDPAYAGASHLKIAIINKNQKPSAALCHSNKLIFKPVSRAYDFLGKYDQYLVIGTANSFGHGQDFEIIALANNKIIYSNTAYDEMPIRFFKYANKTGLSYWKLLKPTCSLLNKQKNQCWQAVLDKNALKTATFPKCKKYDNGTLDNPSMVFMQVQIQDINQPNKEIFIPNTAICLAMP